MQQVDPVLALIVGAFGAAALTTIAGFIGATISSRRDHEKWVRNLRTEAYVEFFQLAGRYDPEGGFGDWAIEVNDAHLRLRLVGTPVVSDAARKYADAVRAMNLHIGNSAKSKKIDPEGLHDTANAQRAAMDEFLAVARKDLGLQDS